MRALKNGAVVCPPPHRIHIRGLISEKFGDRFFLEHAELRDIGANNIVDLALDTVSALLYA